MQRVLLVSLSHALRSAAYLLLPFSFIALIAWSTAGSVSGSTTDPIRGAIWIWLGAHHIPFQLALPPTGIAGYLTYLPIGGLVLPLLVIRSSFTRALEKLKGDYHDLNIVRVNFSVLYALIVTALAFVSRSNPVAAQWYLAPVFAFLIAFISTMTVGNRVMPSRALRISSRVLSILLGVSLILISVLIFINFAQVKDITTSLQPGIFGGLLLLILNILYIPNAIVATLSYFAGVGFAVGSGTLVSPLSFRLNKIPAMPLLGALPDGKSAIALVGIAFVIFAGALLASWTVALNSKVLYQSLSVAILLAAFVGYSASGALITSAMSAVGVSTWKFTLAIGAELATGAALALYLPRLFKRT